MTGRTAKYLSRCFDDDDDRCTDDYWLYRMFCTSFLSMVEINLAYPTLDDARLTLTLSRVLSDDLYCILMNVREFYSKQDPKSGRRLYNFPTPKDIRRSFNFNYHDMLRIGRYLLADKAIRPLQLKWRHTLRVRKMRRWFTVWMQRTFLRLYDIDNLRYAQFIKNRLQGEWGFASSAV